MNNTINLKNFLIENKMNIGVRTMISSNCPHYNTFVLQDKLMIIIDGFIDHYYLNSGRSINLKQKRKKNPKNIHHPCENLQCYKSPSRSPQIISHCLLEHTNFVVVVTQVFKKLNIFNF